LDFIGIQETKKTIIDDGVFNDIDRNMNWNYLLAEATAGGILVGFRDLSFEVISWQNFKLCATAIVKNISDNFIWRLIVVYGSPYDEFKSDFIDELDLIMNNWQGPTLIKGILIWLETRRRKATIKLTSLILICLMGGLISGG
jgi:hypothetical protein